MKDYKYILFDLDGTLTDPKEGITKSVAYALEYYGIHVEDLDTLCKFIGPPLKDSFENYYGFSEEKAIEAVAKYREYFKPYGVYENKVYAGVDNLLSELVKCGKKVVLATSKPTVFAKVILEHFDLLLKEKGEYTATREIRKHIAWYVKGMPNATVIRDKINSVETEEDFKSILKQYFNL